LDRADGNELQKQERMSSSVLGHYLQPVMGSQDKYYNDGDGGGGDDQIVKNDEYSSSNTSSTSRLTRKSTSADGPTTNGMDGVRQESQDANNENVVICKKSMSQCEIRAHMDGIIHMYDSIEYRRLPQDGTDRHWMVKVLGCIEPCRHPAIVDGLCAVCGQTVTVQIDDTPAFERDREGNFISPQDQKMEKSMSQPQNFMDGSNTCTLQRNNLTLSGGVTVSVSTEYAKAFATDAYQSLISAKKLNLVLDLDHTLLHATADPRASSWKNKNREEFRTDVHKFWLPLMEGHPLFQQQSHQPGVTMVQAHYVKLRPHVAEFLSSVMDLYEVTIYTAGTRLYAEKIAQVLSRNVADYQRKLKVLGQDSKGLNNCLDEEDLFLLRQQVDRLREYAKWYKSKKERQEYLARVNEKYYIPPQKQQAEEDECMNDAQNDNTKESEKKNIDDENDEDASDGPHMMAGDDEDSKESPKPKNKKRKRVTFSLPDDHSDNNRVDRGSERTNQCVSGVDSLSLEEDPSDKLKELEEKLLQAEMFEREAQSLRKKIFGSRIVSRTDVGDLGRDVKSLKRVFPCGGMMAVIVDDREDVWANANNNSTGRKGEPPENMLLVRPYHWGPFLKFADVNNPSGVDITMRSDNVESDDSASIEESKEVQLLWTRDILRKIHKRFYDSFGKQIRDGLTVPGVLKQIRREVFGNLLPSAKFILSGLVPLHKQNSTAMHHESPRPDVVRYAEDMGAKILNDVSKDVTHVVAARDGTDKILRARKIPGCAIVKISWLMECYWSCTLRDIEPHILGNKTLPVLKSAIDKKRPILLIGSDSSEDEDENDAFFDEFEKEMEA
jgi:RNA polymerase II subunit A-like phosphatase